MIENSKSISRNLIYNRREVKCYKVLKVLLLKN